MNHPDLIAAMSQEHVGELRAEAGRDRLARIAACCRPSALARRLAALRERLAARTATAACCA